MEYEYKCVAAPEKARRRRGARTRTDRVAGAMEDILKTEAVDGWEYQRTDLLPVEEKSGWFGRSHEVHRAVLVFRRAKAGMRPAAVDRLEAVEPLRSRPEVPTRAPELREVPMPRPESDGEFRLAATREAAVEDDLEPMRVASPRRNGVAPEGIS